jgi:hypothetical protein
MRSLQIENVRATRLQGISELSAVARWSRYGQRDLFFRTTHPSIATSGDPFLAAVLLPAMYRKLDIQLHAQVSDDVVQAAQRVQGVFSAWHRGWHLAKIDALAAAGPTAPSAPAHGVAMFFSGGVDSFYSLQKRRSEVTHLVFVTGFDIPLRNVAMRQLVTTELRRTVERIGLPLIEVETNLRELSDNVDFSWEQQHGAAMAAVAYFLAPSFHKIYVPSTYALPFVVPYGSHPGLDPLWSTRNLDIVHDGIEATRFDKIGALSSSEIALRSLRVCYELVEGQYNCCRCTKCLWTMAFLRAHGALARATTFPQPLDLRALSETTLVKPEERYRFLQALATLDRRRDDHELAAAMRRALQRRKSLRDRATRSLRRMRRSIRTSARRTVHECREFARVHFSPTPRED